MKIIKKLANLVAIAALAAVFVLLAEEATNEAKAYEEPDYADVAGCNPEVVLNYQLCG